MRSQEIQQALEKLKASSADIEAAALVSQEGFIIASVLSENLDEERVAALTAAFQGLAELRMGGDGGPVDGPRHVRR